MLILHHRLEKEAQVVASAIKEAYGISCTTSIKSLKCLYKPIPKFSRFLVQTHKKQSFSKSKTLILTSRDLYFQPSSKEDDWIFGITSDNMAVVSVARLKGINSKPRKNLIVSFELYSKRLKVMAIREIGHILIKNEHMKPAIWVNAKTGYRLYLGEHCVDPRCVMYEVLDITAPLPLEGYILINSTKCFDAGLDDLIKRIYPQWLCQSCRRGLQIDE